MKKFMLLLMMGLCFCLSASAQDAITVQLGDGAPISYFDGFQSEALADPAVLTGVSGAASGSMYEDFQARGFRGGDKAINRTMHMQNIAATDDYLALFFILVYDEPIPFPEGRTQYHINHKIGFVTIQQAGEFIGLDVLVREARMLDDRTLTCMYVISLEQPLIPGETLDFISGFDEKTDAFAYGLHYLLDTENRNDPTIAKDLSLEVPTVPMGDMDGESLREHITRIERIAQTPFGTRIVLNTRNAGGPTSFSYAFADTQGNIFHPYVQGFRSSSDASKEYPAWVRNDVWLLNHHPLEELRLLPIAYTDVYTNPDAFDSAQRTAFVPLTDFPTAISLEDGCSLVLENMALDADGFLIAYRAVNGYNSSVHFELADAEGHALDEQKYYYVGYSGESIAKGLQYFGGFWSEDYKDNIVTRITPEDAAKIGGLRIEYLVGEENYVPEEAVLIDLR